jgi:hypothetical protein
MNKIVVNGKYTYETDLKLKIGDTVLLPATWVDSDPWEATVTALESSYNGSCSKVLSVVNKSKKTT